MERQGRFQRITLFVHMQDPLVRGIGKRRVLDSRVTHRRWHGRPKGTTLLPSSHEEEGATFTVLISWPTRWRQQYRRRFRTCASRRARHHRQRRLLARRVEGAVLGGEGVGFVMMGCAGCVFATNLRLVTFPLLAHVELSTASATSAWLSRGDHTAYGQ